MDGPENWVNPAYLPITVKGEEMYACPRQTLHEQPEVWNRLFLYFQMFKNGFLPDAGAVVDQSNVLLEMLRIMDDENVNCDQALADIHKARQARNARNAPQGKQRNGRTA